MMQTSEIAQASATPRQRRIRRWCFTIVFTLGFVLLRCLVEIILGMAVDHQTFAVAAHEYRWTKLPGNFIMWFLITYFWLYPDVLKYRERKTKDAAKKHETLKKPAASI